ncbi:MAG TPA: TfuA-like protein, partial [Acidimicrobiales bacterium]|nr:TfuA-like protein [Acidimicrobiales bacterium]
MTGSSTSSHRRSVIFLGPTLPAVEARQVFPDADYRPPVAQGDLLSMIGREMPETIGIIDGVFYQDLPVWHKEILLAIERGIEVYGASSMGALRAAECRPFGMVGVGSIFEGYVAGELM